MISATSTYSLQIPFAVSFWECSIYDCTSLGGSGKGPGSTLTIEIDVFTASGRDNLAIGGPQGSQRTSKHV